jgi:hypothetical protein
MPKSTTQSSNSWSKILVNSRQFLGSDFVAIFEHMKANIGNLGHGFCEKQAQLVES